MHGRDVGPVRDDRAGDVNDSTPMPSDERGPDRKEPGIREREWSGRRGNPNPADPRMWRKVDAAGYQQHVVTEVGEVARELLELSLHAPDAAYVMRNDRHRH
jgi:hypothetical protein